MSKTFVCVPLAHNVYYKLPEGIKTLEDDRIEWFYFNLLFLTLKLKDKEDEIKIEPSHDDEEVTYYVEDKMGYMDKEDVFFYETDEDSDEEN